jgi:hypothetical protein
MEKQRLLSRLFFIPLSLSIIIASAQEKQKKKYEFVSEKDFSQTYTVSDKDKLNLSNQFGTVDIKTWNKNEVKVDVHIVTSSNVKEANDERFQNINIKHSKESNTIYFQTDIENGNNQQYKGNQNNTIDVDYIVYMPANIQLTVKNKFGKTIVPDLNSDVTIKQEFGELVAGRLPQNSDIEVKFSKAFFEALNNADLSIEFANAPIVIKNASGKLDLQVKHSSHGVTIYADKITELDIDADFSDVGLVVDKNLSADFKIKTNFGSLSNKTSFVIKDENEEREERKYGPTFTHTYRGTTGSGKTKVNLDGKYSDIIISHEAPTFSKKGNKKRSVSI